MTQFILRQVAHSIWEANGANGANEAIASADGNVYSTVICAEPPQRWGKFWI